MHSKAALVSVWSWPSSQATTSLQSGLITYENCVKSLPGRQAPPLANPRLQPFSFLPSMRCLGLFQNLGVQYLHSLAAKGRAAGVCSE